jgi:L-fuculose-phosphate aldolase
MSREKYIGTKFTTIFTGDFKPSPAERALIKKLIAAGHTIGGMQIKDKNGGNFSARVKQGIIIKRTGAHPYNLKPKDFVLVQKFVKDRVWAAGKVEPSSEARLHLSVYKANPKVNCILHCHDFVAVFCPKKIAGIGYIREIPYGTLESARAVSRAAKKYDYAIMENHGVIAFGKDIAAALKLIKRYHARFEKLNHSCLNKAGQK